MIRINRIRYRQWAKVAFLATGLVAAYAASTHGGTERNSEVVLDSFVVENSLSATAAIEAGGAPGLDRATFDHVLDRVDRVYTPIFAGMGRKFVIEREWDNDTVNATALFGPDDSSIIRMFGGLARYPGMTADSWLLVACHEIGHHIGGAPRFQAWNMSVEGQADYYASLKCMRIMFAEDDNSAWLASPEADPFAKKLCLANHADARDAAICVRSSVAAKHSGSVTRDAHFSRPDLFNVSPLTQTYHPEPQCRLDTFLAGAVCNRAVSDAVDARDPNRGTCGFAPGGSVLGFRPLCWWGALGAATELAPPQVREEAMRLPTRINEAAKAIEKLRKRWPR